MHSDVPAALLDVTPSEIHKKDSLITESDQNSFSSLSEICENESLGPNHMYRNVDKQPPTDSPPSPTRSAGREHLSGSENDESEFVAIAS